LEDQTFEKFVAKQAKNYVDKNVPGNSDKAVALNAFKAGFKNGILKGELSERERLVKGANVAMDLWHEADAENAALKTSLSLLLSVAENAARLDHDPSWCGPVSPCLSCQSKRVLLQVINSGQWEKVTGNPPPRIT